MRSAALLLLLALTGCRCGPETPVDAGVDAGEPPVDAGPAGEVRLLLDPNFGAVVRGGASGRVATFENGTTRDVRITGFAVDGPFQLVTAPPLTLRPGEASSAVRVQFAPTSLGALGGALRFEVDGAPRRVVLIGDGIGPKLLSSPDQLPLGALTLYDGVATTSSAALTLTNAGRNAVPPRPETDVQLTFEVVALQGSASELCVGACDGASLRVTVGDTITLPIHLTATTAGPREYELRLFSNDPDRPLRTVRVTAELVRRPTCEFSLPARLDFGVLSDGEQRDAEVVFENIGLEPCEVTSISLAGAQRPGPPVFALVSAPSTPRTVAPGEGLRLRLRAHRQGLPAPLGTAVSWRLELAVNHPHAPAATNVSATIDQACFSMTPSPVDFGTVRAGCSGGRKVWLNNWCHRDLQVTVLGTSSPLFTAPVTSIVLQVDQSVELALRYAPAAVGDDLALLNVAWGDPGALIFSRSTLELRGRANQSGVNVDLFPPLGNQHDVLLVLDDSASMTPVVPTMQAQLPRLLTQLQQAQVDFHLAVVDASVVNRGELRAATTGEKVLTPQTPNVAQRFTELTRFIGLLDWESCSAPVLRALSMPLVGDPGTNAGFRRPGVPLSVVCVIDQTDYDAWFTPEVLGTFGPSLRWNVVSTFSVTPGCNLGTGEPGHNLTDATGGRRHELCSSDWSPLLDAVAGRTTSTPRTFFPLSGAQDLTGQPPLAVSLNGQPLAAANVWEWLSAPNAVVFSPLAAPAPSDRVEVSWPTVCTP